MENSTPTSPLVLEIASEAVPFAKTGGLADVLPALSRDLKSWPAAIVMPLYKTIRRDGFVKAFEFPVSLADGLERAVVVHTTTDNGVVSYFVECGTLFERDGLYGEGGIDYPDNHLRFAVFSVAAIELARRLGTPKILHCHDWQTALVPVYLKTRLAHDDALGHLKTVLTIHNLGYQGLCDPAILTEIGLDSSLFHIDRLEFHGKVNLLKGGLVYADALTTVSPTYSEEVRRPELGFGLDGLLRHRGDAFVGILNGADYSVWDPQHDKYIACPYTAADLSGKAECKRALLVEVGLPASAGDKPLIGIVSRLDSQKGLDLVDEAAEDIGALGCTVVVLGAGHPKIEESLRRWATANPNSVAVKIGFDNGLAHRIEAGSDMFLMASRYEPCGLNQMYSLRYGTVPVVRATGGLADTVVEDAGSATGFKFRDYSADALLDALRRATSVYREQPETWQQMMLRGMAADFSWARAAGAYSKLFEALLR